MNVMLLVNEKELVEFCKAVLPPLENDEVLISVITARKKYGEISRSEEILDKTILKQSEPGYVVRRLRKFGFVEGCYIDYKTGKVLTGNCMVMYIDILPRSVVKAFRVFTNHIQDWIYQALFSEEFNYEIFRKLDTKLFSALARSVSRALYYIIDIDNKDKGLLDKVTKLLGDSVVWVSETRGGYHVIVHKNKETGRIIYKELSKTPGIEIFGKQGQTPVPGTLQGGFLVKKVEW